MVYGPMIRSATLLTEVPLGERHVARQYHEVVSAGSIEYRFVVAVFAAGDDEPCLFVTSEKNQMAGESGGSSHFLCVFESDTHYNLGDHDGWADPDRFFPESLRVAADRLDLDP